MSQAAIAARLVYDRIVDVIAEPRRPSSSGVAMTGLTHAWPQRGGMSADGTVHITSTFESACEYAAAATGILEGEDNSGESE